jgi:hypothetical protein
MIVKRRTSPQQQLLTCLANHAKRANCAYPTQSINSFLSQSRDELFVLDVLCNKELLSPGREESVDAVEVSG